MEMRTVTGLSGVGVGVGEGVGVGVEVDAPPLRPVRPHEVGEDDHRRPLFEEIVPQGDPGIVGGWGSDGDLGQEARTLAEEAIDGAGGVLRMRGPVSLNAVAAAGKIRAPDPPVGALSGVGDAIGPPGPAVVAVGIMPPCLAAFTIVNGVEQLGLRLPVVHDEVSISGFISLPQPPAAAPSIGHVCLQWIRRLPPPSEGFNERFLSVLETDMEVEMGSGTGALSGLVNGHIAGVAQECTLRHRLALGNLNVFHVHVDADHLPGFVEDLHLATFLSNKAYYSIRHSVNGGFDGGILSSGVVIQSLVAAVAAFSQVAFTSISLQHPAVKAGEGAFVVCVWGVVIQEGVEGVKGRRRRRLPERARHERTGGGVGGRHGGDPQRVGAEELLIRLLPEAHFLPVVAEEGVEGVGGGVGHLGMLRAHPGIKAESQVMLPELAADLSDGFGQRAVPGDLPVQGHPGGDQQHPGVDQREWSVGYAPDLIGQGALEGMHGVFHRFHPILGPGRGAPLQRLLQHPNGLPHPHLDPGLQVPVNRIVNV
jgi:hypothetical protein